MYAANILASDKYDNNFFYWLFPKPEELSSEKDSASPLIIYMNGGPGSTSMNALFTEMGPLYAVKTDEDDEDSYQVWYDAENSWQSAGDLLFVDMPVGTGYSYGTHSPTSLDEIAADFLTFFLNFLEEHDEYWSRKFVITGESFAGKYLSYISREILDYNESADADHQINLKNLILSNPLVDVPTERVH
jgi:carboxypeptidase C (cathepsin A)